MDASGVEAAALHAAYYGFLAETEDLAAVAPLPQQDLDAAALAGASTSSGKGRKRTKQLADADSDELSEDDEEGGKRGKRKPTDAARNKASREKARREKINDRFLELAQLVEPNKEPKTDKLSVLGEAIRTVQQLQVENHQLKQLNKFLEEKTANLERERAQNMFFQMQGGMMQQQAGMVAPMGGMMMQQPAGPMVMAPGMMGMIQPATMQQQQQQQPGMVARVQSSGALTQQQQQQQSQQQGQLGQQQQPQQQGQAGQQQQPQHQQQEQQAAFNTGNLLPGAADVKTMSAAVAGMPGAMMGQPGVYWQSMVPQNMLDANQDSLLRPPAA